MYAIRSYYVFADEPTGNLDSLMAREVMSMLEEINGEGTTIVMVTHDPELARRLPDVVEGHALGFRREVRPRLVHVDVADA